MITRFFRISKPFHYILFLLGLILLFFFQYGHQTGQDDFFSLLKQGLTLIAFLLSLFLSVFIITKNNLTDNNSFAALYFCGLIFLTPQSLSDWEIIFSNLFVMLSFRRVFSLKTKQNLKKKYFDAALWVTIATLFYVWSAFYFIPLLVSIVMWPKDRFKHIAVVFFGTLAVFIFDLILSIVFGFQVSILNLSLPTLNFEFSTYRAFSPLLSIALLSVMVISALLNFLIQLFLNNIQRKDKILLTLMLTIGLIAPVLSTDKTLANALFLFFPLAVLMANFTEQQKTNWISNMFLFLLLAVVFLKWGFNTESHLALS